MTGGDVLIVACAFWCALCCLVLWLIIQRERRFLQQTLADLQRINDEWHADMAAFAGLAPKAPATDRD